MLRSVELEHTCYFGVIKTHEIVANKYNCYGFIQTIKAGVYGYKHRLLH